MNDNWIAMMVYAPLTKESDDTDYQKEEEFKEEDVDAVVEETMVLVGESEDYFGAIDKKAEKFEEVIEAYDDYEALPEIPAEPVDTCSAEEVFIDIYSGEEYWFNINDSDFRRRFFML